MDSFLPASYEEELVPALKEAQEKLCFSATGFPHLAEPRLCRSL